MSRARGKGGGGTQTQGELLQKARQGDAEAFSALMAPFAPMVYRHCLGMLKQTADAEDAAQEAMLRAYRALPRFLGQSQIATWLYRIAHNTCLDMLKKPARERENASLEAMREAGFEPESGALGPEDQVLRAGEAQRLRAAVAKLPKDQQALISLRYGDGLAYDELARLLGMKEGTVKSKLNRAKARLKELLRED